MQEGGVEGKYTNHSLRATSASRMYHRGVPEQVIKEVTGHKSDCVRYYKRTNDDIRKEASNVIAGCDEAKSPKKCKLDTEVKECEGEQNVEDGNNVEASSDDKIGSPKKELSLLQMVRNVLRTKAEIARKKVGSNAKLLKCKKVLVSKILKQSKIRQVAKEMVQKKRKITIDVNVNFNIRQ